MRYILSFGIFLYTIGSYSQFRSVTVDTLLLDKISIRAIAIDGTQIWYAGDKGKFGVVDTAKKTREKRRVFSDSLQPEFRSIAVTKDFVYLLNIGNPAQLYQVPKAGGDPKIVYGEKGPKVFYDSMQFWNDNDGIAIGDPVDNCLSILITNDGGNTWKKMPCGSLPKLVDGEAAFAASNTNIVLKENNTWIVSGGKKSRVFYSADKAKSWKVFNTPMINGGTTTGAYTADFYDGNNGFIAGGDYEKPDANSKNKAFTSDGGKTWSLIADGSGFGYASCVQYIPQSDAKGLVCVGAAGLQYSSDGGKTWIKLWDDKNLYTIRFINSETAIAAGKDKIVRIRFLK